MTTTPPEGPVPAAVVAPLADADVDRIAAAVVTKLLDGTKIVTTDSPNGRYVRTLLRGVFDGTQRIVKRVGA